MKGSKISTPTPTRHPLFLPFMWCAISLGFGAIGFAVYELLRMPFSYQWILLASVAVLCSPFTIKIPGTNSKISISDTFFFTNVVLYGTPAGIITAALDALVSSLRKGRSRRRLEYAVFNLATMAFSALLGGTVFFHMIGRGPLDGSPTPTAQEVFLPLVVLALLHYLWNSGSVATVIALESGKKVRTVWQESFLWTSITYFAGAAAAGYICVGLRGVSPLMLAVILPVLVATYFTYKTYLDKVNELNSALRQVNNLAYYDALTTLPNRLLFTDKLNLALADAELEKQQVAVMFLDLDHFKRINDTFGHGLGDLLLKAVADRLSASLRCGDVASGNDGAGTAISLGRFGGDEFTLLLRNFTNIDDVASVAQRILDAVSKPIEVGGHEIFVTVSIGISLSPADGATADTLLKNADTAMYCSKDNGRAGYHFYSIYMNERSMRKLSLENDLRRALERGEFVLHYQPKLDAHRRMPVGLEALIRWAHPARGLLLPAEFIQLAEETGLIIPIGEWVLRTVCVQIMTWLAEGGDPLPVAVNLSCVQFRQKDLLQTISQILREIRVDPRYIELEITESTVMQNDEEAGRTLRGLASLGVRLSIDDFGTGYSSLSSLKRFTLDTLKIDRSFVKDVSHDADDRAIISAIIGMAHTLGLKVVAEGLDTEEQMAFLKDQGCDELQGFLFTRALPAKEISTWLEENRPWSGSTSETYAPQSGYAKLALLVRP
jgi:diguanylate cyclase (GGDEF)-like protein